MSGRVFLSHAAADGAQARRLRSLLDGYRVTDPIGGTHTLHVTLGGGEGEYHAEAAEPLDEELAECEALIVLCSANTAADPWVNHAVDHFVTRGRLRWVFPVIAPDAPPVFDYERDFYPPALAGRGLLAADLRETRGADGAVMGDGLEGGVLKLVATLSGLEVHQIAQQDRKRQRTRIAVLTAAVGVLAAATIGAASFGIMAQRSAMTIEAQRQLAVRNALQAAQSRDQALAASEAENQNRARADQQLDRSRERLAQSLRSLGQLTNQRLDEIAQGPEATPAALSFLHSTEDIYWNLAEASPFLELRPATVTDMIERIAGVYTQLGRAEDAQRVAQRFARLNQRISGYAGADPAWRNSYASAILELASRRGRNGDKPGQIAAYGQAAQIVEPICVDAPDAEAPASRIELRANACLRFANIALSRAGVQEQAEITVATAPLERAKILLEAAISAYPDNRRLQENGARLKTRIEALLTRIAEERARPPSETN